MSALQGALQMGVHSLIWPVVIALTYLYVATIVAAGEVSREAWSRWRGGVNGRLPLESAIAGCRQLPASQRELQLETLLQQYEGRQLERINRLRMAIRLGPSLGLIGTLIPMARALAELANGNLPALAHNMVNAFASTVMGIAVSVVAYVLAVTRETWMRRDDRELRLQAERCLMEAEQFSEVADEVR